MSQNLSSAAVVIGSLRVNMKIMILFFPLYYLDHCLINMAGNANFQIWVKKCLAVFLIK